MRKGLMVFIGLVLSFALFCGYAEASVLGSWKTNYTGCVTVVLGGVPYSESGSFKTTFTFKSNKVFTTPGAFRGTWKQSGKKFTVTPNIASIRAFLIGVCAAYYPGQVSNITVTSATMSGTESTNKKSISGQIKISARGSVKGYGLATLSMTLTFNGTRIPGLFPEEESPPTDEFEPPALDVPPGMSDLFRSFM